MIYWVGGSEINNSWSRVDIIYLFRVSEFSFHNKNDPASPPVLIHFQFLFLYTTGAWCPFLQQDQEFIIFFSNLSANLFIGSKLVV